jgi:molybdopterin synthase catalytic subunit
MLKLLYFHRFPEADRKMSKQTICEIVETEIHLDEMIKKLSSDSTGAIVVFTGMVRGITTGKHPHETIYLEYDAYLPMAEKMMNRIADEIREKWSDIESIAIIQRIGRMIPGTPTVAIACSAAHRNTGVFEAAKYGIDRLKEIVPVWKKESGKSEESWIMGDYFPQEGD